MKAQSLQHQLLLPLMALLLALMLGNALLMQSALNWGSEAQTRQQLVYQAQFWQARLPAYSQQIDSFTWLVLAYDDLPATVREQVSPLWRGLDELSGAQEDVFILSWPKPAGEVFYLLFNTQQIEPDEPLETQVMLRYGLLIGPAVLLGLLCLWWLIRRAVQPLKQVQQQLQMWMGMSSGPSSYCRRIARLKLGSCCRRSTRRCNKCGKRWRGSSNLPALPVTNCARPWRWYRQRWSVCRVRYRPSSPLWRE